MVEGVTCKPALLPLRIRTWPGLLKDMMGNAATMPMSVNMSTTTNAVDLPIIMSVVLALLSYKSLFKTALSQFSIVAPCAG